MNLKERILGGLWGSLVGDALGVPVEFEGRAMVQSALVTDMRGFGTHDQPPGTWSDDSSLLLCSVESLLHCEFDTEDMGRRFLRWYREALWTPHGRVFDVGVATSVALNRIAQGVPAEQAGGVSAQSNGNGSLMRILPVCLRFAREPVTQLLERVQRASAITHRHARSRMACAFHALVARELLHDRTPQAALDTARAEFTVRHEHAAAFPHFRSVLQDDLVRLPENEVASTGYVLHTLHAGLWCLLTTRSFAECVLRAVNLGGDTDTTGCVAGGLAGVHYGLEQIPESWRCALARHDEVEKLFGRFAAMLVACP